MGADDFDLNTRFAEMGGGSDWEMALTYWLVATFEGKSGTYDDVPGVGTLFRVDHAPTAVAEFTYHG